MIQQAPGKTTFLLLVFLGITCPVKSQNTIKTSPDTIVVYDTKIVYDTLFIYDTIRISKPIRSFITLPLRFADTLSEIKLLPYDTLLVADTILLDKIKEKYLHTSQLNKQLSNNPLDCLSQNIFIQPDEVLCELPATNFKKSIISIKSNMKLMKSETHNITNTHQYRWGLSAGGGGWWARSRDANLQTNVLFTPHFGAFYEEKISHHLRFKVELNYRWVATKGIQFSQDNFSGFIQSPSTPGITESDIFSWDVDGEKTNEFRFSQIEIPIKLGYKTGSFQPCIGFDYTRRFKHNKVHNGNYFNVIAGLDIHLSNRLSLELCYSHGIRGEIQRNGQVMGIIVGNIITLPGSKTAFTAYPPADYLSKNTGKLSSRRIALSLSFNLHNN